MRLRGGSTPAKGVGRPVEATLEQIAVDPDGDAFPVELAEDAVALRMGEGFLVWGLSIGRGAWSATFGPDDVARIGRLGLLAGMRRASVLDLVPAKSRLPLFRPDQGALWFPIAARPAPGGHAWGAVRLDPAALALWSAIDGTRTLQELAIRHGIAIQAAIRAARQLCHPAVQAVQMRPGPVSAKDPALLRVVGPPRPEQARGADLQAGRTDLLAYHLAIDDGPVHFDDRETTVAHALGLPSEALSGRTYGQALHERVIRGDDVVEVGCGDGAVAEAVWSGMGQQGRYVRVDLSPELQRTQARRAPGTLGIVADALRLPFRDGSVRFLFSNEMIADLPADRDRAAPDVAPRVERYRIPPTAGFYNVGTWRFIEEIARVLAPGGSAWVSEFGGEEAAEATQLDHPEVAIHTGHLLAVARGCGLQAELRTLQEELAVDVRALQPWRPHHHAIRAMHRAEGLHWPARALSPKDHAAALPWPIEGIRYVDQNEEGPGPLIGRFFALRMTKVSR